METQTRYRASTMYKCIHLMRNDADRDILKNILQLTQILKIITTFSFLTLAR